MAHGNAKWTLSWIWPGHDPTGVGMDSPDPMDLVIGQVLNYLGHFDCSNGLLTHLNWGPIV